MWTISGRTPNDTYLAKSNLSRGVSNIAGRGAYSRTKMTPDTSSNLSSNKRVAAKEPIQR